LFNGVGVNGEIISGAISSINSNTLRENSKQVSYMRISAIDISNNSILTVNQPIEE
jgi:hypothetical protein